VFSGDPWESEVGYCRAIRVANQVFVSGTAPLNDDGSVHGIGDPYLQAKRCLEIIAKAMLKLGCPLSAVVRTRLFVTDISQ
jgi:enamine deaminase RidA (YjgF/YER057c/UK114 family)